MLRPCMRFSLQAQYAICGVFDLAYNGRGVPVQVRVVSERQGMPARYLEQIFRRLRRAEIIAAKRGPGGGYTLARPASEITLGEIVEAVEGPIGDALHMPSASGAEVFRPGFLWQELADRLGQVLEDITLEALCRGAVGARVKRARAGVPMKVG